ncbi:RNA polymerase sigma factor, sigma-70 family protein [Phocaeicola vulgatus str. 3775 SL(B) 10 (iv)]|nr:RNA polymerase sigma factor, sigma-70 family protein [Phocaeicola vulgatus str. 3775 SL(B) 10 (iv)]
MYGVCYRYVGEDSALDVMHDGFVKVFSAIGQLHATDLHGFRSWITRIMVTTSLHHLRKQKNSSFLSVDDLEENMQPVDEEDMISIPIETLMKFIAELPTGYRTILNLAVFEEMPHKEIAKTLGINEHSSSSQLYRAKCILAQKIKEYLTRQSL